MPIECLASHWHFGLIEWVLHHKVRIKFVNLLYDCVHVSGHRIREQQEFCPRQRLEARQSKLVGLEVV
jgi:hypothetical protein